MVFNCLSLFNEAAYLAALRRLRSPFAISDAQTRTNQRQKYMILKIFYLLLRISAVTGRYGPHFNDCDDIYDPK